MSLGGFGRFVILLPPYYVLGSFSGSAARGVSDSGLCSQEGPSTPAETGVSMWILLFFLLFHGAPRLAHPPRPVIV